MSTRCRGSCFPAAGHQLQSRHSDHFVLFTFPFSSLMGGWHTEMPAPIQAEHQRPNSHVSAGGAYPRKPVEQKENQKGVRTFLHGFWSQESASPHPKPADTR
mmetsp:Transcript_58828/g.95081  ORF Transcript_58828/g.95081 Transcript_58828/m.95081 type:complete len:102 (+) Transcript_58828:266-571(+)